MPSNILADPSKSDRDARPSPWRALWFALGAFWLMVGVVGVFVPLLPTTGPLIAALACFARSSPRLEVWLLTHPRFGPSLRAWREQGAVPRIGKVAAGLGVALGFGLFWLLARPGLLFGVCVGAVLMLCAAYVVSRPAPRRGGPRDGV
ncbi:YbaN family protein [Brevundimonas vesicularis]|uniref:DUF454 domain-containing protein n=2 Tax=Brevundimonas vesicularis TaxID=41276 RepID=A0A1Z3U4Z4_BREVE|nr:YbaN family protein [Brevundimonas vesicularis]ASE38338.1 DUF454 domain-containing protein [Brevundimonas vesicularis]